VVGFDVVALAQRRLVEATFIFGKGFDLRSNLCQEGGTIFRGGNWLGRQFGDARGLA
jgi:hypothetical protein